MKVGSYVGERQIGAGLLHQPFFTGHARLILSIGDGLLRAQSNGLIGADDGGANLFLDAHFLARNVRGGTFEQPFVARSSVLLGCFIIEIENRFQSESGIRWNDFQRRDWLENEDNNASRCESSDEQHT